MYYIYLEVLFLQEKTKIDSFQLHLKLKQTVLDGAVFWSFVWVKIKVCQLEHFESNNSWMIYIISSKGSLLNYECDWSRERRLLAGREKEE